MSKQNTPSLFINECYKLLAVLFVLSLLFSCDRDNKEETPPQQPPEEVRQLSLYTSVPLKEIAAIVKEFEKTHPEIALNVTRNGTTIIMAQLQDEAKVGKVEADVVWLSDFSNGEELKAQGLLSPYQSPQVAGVYPLFRDAEHYYTGSRLLNMVVAYNTRAVKKPPSNYRSLLDPQWRGRVGIVNPEVSGAGMYTLTAMLQDQRFGQEYFAGLVENDAKVIRNNRYMAEMIATGELHIGITIDFSVRSLRGLYDDFPIDYIYPSDGTIVIASPIAITRDCNERQAAQTFVDWVLSKQGQTFMSRQLGIMTVRNDVLPPEGMPALANLIIFPADPETILKGKQDALAEYRRLMVPKPKESK